MLGSSGGGGGEGGGGGGEGGTAAAAGEREGAGAVEQQGCSKDLRCGDRPAGSKQDGVDKREKQQDNGQAASKQLQNKNVFPLFLKRQPRQLKTVYLIRHGHTAWPTAALATEAGSGDSSRFDVRLTSLGIEQARGLQQRLASIHAELVVTSPLTRALQTSIESRANEKAPLEIWREHTEHIACSGDIGRHPEVLATEFPSMRFDHLPPVWWYSRPDAPNDAPGQRFGSREPKGHLRQRVGVFRKLLQQRPERSIIVIGHSTFFMELLGSRKRMANCEVAAMQL